MMSTRTYRLVLGIVLLAAASLRADDWPQWAGPKRDNIWREEGIVEKFPAGGPVVRWRVPIAAGYASPAVANGRVYVMDRVVPAGTTRPIGSYKRGNIPGAERILCLDATDGKIVWQDEYPCTYTISYGAGPRTTPLVADGKVYTLGAEGDLQCRDAATGKVAWKTRLSESDEPATPIWGYSASPLLDGEKIICLGGDRTGIVTAHDRTTGKLIWRAVPAANAGYTSPMIYQFGRTRQLIIWHPEALVSLDPETGKEYWSDPLSIKNAVPIAPPVQVGDLLFTSSAHEGLRMMKLDLEKPTAKRLWHRMGTSDRRTDALHALMATPIVQGDYIYGTCIYGQLRCVRLADGERVWETFAATTGEAGPARWANAFLIPHKDRFFLANESGELIIAKLTPKGYEEISRAKLLEPTNRDCGRLVVWSHPAFANRCVFMRNDKEIICVSLAAQ